ncbi:tetratricopeptide repeat protein [Dialister succinatiphilus]|uniref:tetratricopeptide repeat protein n=1 Tax=Dialister succinatiphilus TaxID=487173 RepID=UPI0040285CAA
MENMESMKEKLEAILQEAEALRTEFDQLEARAEKSSPEKALQQVLAKGSFPSIVHYMAGKEGATSYMNLLIFAAFLMNPYAECHEDGMIFLENLRQALGIKESLEALMSAQLGDKHSRLASWLRVVKESGAEALFAVDAILLYSQLKAGQEGLRKISALFNLLGLSHKTVGEAAGAALGIIHNDYRELAQAAASWNRDLALALGERIPTDLLLEKAQQLFIKDHVKEALPLFEELVRRDNPRAMYFMGEYYRSGWAGFSVNKEEGFKYHHRGADKGEVLCRLNCAYEEGISEEQKKKLIFETLPEMKRLASAGDIIAQDELGDVYYNTIDNEIAGYYWEKKAVEAGYWRPLLKWAGRAEGIEKVNFYAQLYEINGDHAGEMANKIGVIYDKAKDYETANSWYRKGIEKGYDWAMRNLGMSYLEGDGVPVDKNKAKALLQQAISCHGEAESDARKQLSDNF